MGTFYFIYNDDGGWLHGVNKKGLKMLVHYLSLCLFIDGIFEGEEGRKKR